ncbi:hypothetical protein JXA40_00610 [bacterium]|nr:hypothetical protein [candidate division CSSED10-310 bacterium]
MKRHRNFTHTFVIRIALLLSACPVWGQIDTPVQDFSNLSAGSSRYWTDVPIFPDTEELGTDIGKVHPGYHRMEIRRYLSDSKPAKIFSYFRNQMVHYQWTLHSSHEMNGRYYTAWKKNGGDPMVWIKIRETRYNRSLIEIIRVEGRR